MAFTIQEEAKLKAIAIAANKADAVAALRTTKVASMDAAKVVYEAAVKDASDIYDAAVLGLEK